MVVLEHPQHAVVAAPCVVRGEELRVALGERDGGAAVLTRSHAALQTTRRQQLPRLPVLAVDGVDNVEELCVVVAEQKGEEGHAVAARGSAGDDAVQLL